MRFVVLVLLLAVVHADERCAADDPACAEPATPKKKKKDKAWFKENTAARKAMDPSLESYSGYLPISKPLPRISVEKLELPKNADYKNRRRPFILTGAMDGWPALDIWPIDPAKPASEAHLAQLFPQAVSDFYPYNMLKGGTHPFLYRFRSGVDEMLEPNQFQDTAKHSSACEDGCRYLHLQLTPSMWSQLEESKEMPAKRHFHLKGDSWWMRRCLADPALQSEYMLKTHWKILLIGSKGAGMFNHSDSLLTSSWHGHVQGRKWWMVCGNLPSGKHRCYESILKPGEVLYYGKHWHHHTRLLDTPTMTITGTSVHQSNFKSISTKLWGECARADLSFDFSGALCDALDVCYPLWHKVLTGETAPSGMFTPWRETASPEEQRVKDQRKPEENNYDGRNHIGG